MEVSNCLLIFKLEAVARVALKCIFEYTQDHICNSQALVNKCFADSAKCSSLSAFLQIAYCSKHLHDPLLVLTVECELDGGKQPESLRLLSSLKHCASSIGLASFCKS